MRTVQERFWQKVDKSSGDGCWLWTGSILGNGYGQFWIDGRNHMARRVAWQLAFGAIPEGLLTCHNCENPTCVRPEHLFLGTHADRRTTPQTMATVQERFWEKVSKSVDANGCWLWKASLWGSGYGQFNLDGRMRGAHHLSLEWAVGPRPPGMEACHSCRNKHCVAPHHLRWDTKLANEADKKKDGTAPVYIGERNNGSKLCEGEVAVIRAAVAAGRSCKHVAEHFSVDPSLVSLIARRKAWAHV